MLSSQKVIHRNHEIVSEPSAQGLFLLNTSTGLYYSLNPVGAFVWQGLEEGADLDQIVQRMTSRWSVSEREAKADVRELVRDLERQGLVAKHSEAGP